jgi:poly-gamma-glutamate capsule biosynthesis protein CapA/YwtB (metallophosphatase superfamily)
MSTPSFTPNNADAPEFSPSEPEPSVLDRLRAFGQRRPGASVAGVIVLVVIVIGVGLTAVAAPAEGPQAVWRPPLAANGSAGPTGGPTASTAPDQGSTKAITLSAVGDIIMGDAPGDLPPNGGKGFFDKAKALLSADLVMGNMEQPITEDTGSGKCPPPPTNPPPGWKNNCHQFRVPPSFANNLKDAGFDLLNMANNHGRDYGAAGFTNTQRSLEKAGLQHTGATDEITVAAVNGVKVGVVGFSSYSGNNSLINLASAKKVIEKAAKVADVVVVQVHMGAEGADKSHVRPGTETYLGENRGDPYRFSRAVIDAGADLVVGHGPHVVRGMEFYKGRLIAYSLGNFAGGGQLSTGYRVGWGGVLKVTINPDGSFVTGRFASTFFGGGNGLPEPDSQERALGLIKQMTTEDFGAAGARFTADGRFSQPSLG